MYTGARPGESYREWPARKKDTKEEGDLRARESGRTENVIAELSL